MIKMIKKMKSITVLVCIAVVFLGCDSLVTNYEYDSSAEGYRNTTLLAHFENDFYQDCTMHCQAIRLVGLKDVIEAGGVTCVVMNNTAFNTLLSLLRASSLEEANPVLLRELLLYLIFPGDYRALNMTPGESYRIESLSGDPIFIKRSPGGGDKYRMMINDNRVELASSPAEVRSQDFLFKNQVVAQVVTDFVFYKPIVDQTDEKPEGYENPNMPTATLTVSEDTFLSEMAAYRDAPQNNNSYGIRMSATTNNHRNTLLKFPLDPISFKEDIYKAKLVTRVASINGYTFGEECIFQVREFHNNWTELEATWNSIRKVKNFPVELAPIIINNTAFIVESNDASYYLENPTFLYTDITPSVIKHYKNDSTHINLFLEDISAGRALSAHAINLCDKDRFRYLSTIELTGSGPSELTLVRNNPAVVSNGKVKFNPDIHFAMVGPEVSDEGLNYKDANIIYTASRLPTNGILTVYGIPMAEYSRFSQADMRAGVVKYLRTGSGTSDSFTFKVYDYVGGVYGDELTISIQ